MRRAMGVSTHWQSLAWKALSWPSVSPSSLTFLPPVNRVMGGRPNARRMGANMLMKPARERPTCGVR